MVEKVFFQSLLENCFFDVKFLCFKSNFETWNTCISGANFLPKSQHSHNDIKLQVNLYLRGVHPLSTTGLLPILYLIFANIRISQGIKKLRKPKVATAIVSMSGSNFIELNCNIVGANSKSFYDFKKCLQYFFFKTSQLFS